MSHAILDDVDIGSLRFCWIADVGMSVTSLRVFTSNLALTKKIREKRVVLLANTARSLSVPVVVSI
jgi:hypothetical protein